MLDLLAYTKRVLSVNRATAIRTYHRGDQQREFVPDQGVNIVVMHSYDIRVHVYKHSWQLNFV